MTDQTTTPPSKPGLPAALQSQLRSMSGDMTLLGVVEIIAGALYCLTIIGAAIGVPMILAGLRLKNSAGEFTAYTLGAESAHLHGALEHLGRHFRIHKILFFVGIGLLVLYIIFIVFIVGMFVSDIRGQL